MINHLLFIRVSKIKSSSDHLHFTLIQHVVRSAFRFSGIKTVWVALGVISNKGGVLPENNKIHQKFIRAVVKSTPKPSPTPLSVALALGRKWPRHSFVLSERTNTKHQGFQGSILKHQGAESALVKAVNNRALASGC